MDESLIGQWIAVTYSYSVAGMFSSGGGLHSAFGVLESANDAALVIRQGNGETLYLPFDLVRSIAAMEEPEGATLLRPAEQAGERRTLVHPAESAPEDTLLRTASSEND